MEPAVYSVQVTGELEALHAFLRAHPHEVNVLERKGSLITVRLLVAERLAEVLPRFGLQVESRINLADNATAIHSEIGAGNRFLSAVPLWNLLKRSTDYLNVDEVHTAVETLHAQYPNMTELIDLPCETALGTRCKALRLGGGARGTSDVIVITGCVHGFEWGSAEIALNFAIDLLDADLLKQDLTYGGKTFSHAEVSALLRDRHIVVFPVVNPDGRRFSQILGNRSWRKNRNEQNKLPGDEGSIGVDINRNFDFLFDFQQAFVPGTPVVVSDSPSHYWLYQGPEPFSEPESRNVKWLFDTFARTRWYVDLHSPGPKVLHAWSDDQMQIEHPSQNFANSRHDRERGAENDSYSEYVPPADLHAMQALAQALADGIVAANGPTYPVEPSYGYYGGPMPGASHDYAYSRHFLDSGLSRILGFVVEWGHDRQPEWIRMRPIVSQVTAGLIAFCLAT